MSAPTGGAGGGAGRGTIERAAFPHPRVASARPLQASPLQQSWVAIRAYTNEVLVTDAWRFAGPSGYFTIAPDAPRASANAAGAGASAR